MSGGFLTNFLSSLQYWSGGGGPTDMPSPQYYMYNKPKTQKLVLNLLHLYTPSSSFWPSYSASDRANFISLPQIASSSPSSPSSPTLPLLPPLSISFLSLSSAAANSVQLVGSPSSTDGRRLEFSNQSLKTLAVQHFAERRVYEHAAHE